MTGRKKNIYKPLGYIATGVFFLFGRYIISRLVSKGQGEKLNWLPPKDDRYIQCPTGNTWYAQFDGPADGPPLVFIHGLNADHTQWYYQRKYFNKKYRLIFLDLPIHTKQYSSHQLAIPTLAEDIKNILDQLGIKNAIIYGHSMAGTILIQYCLRYTPNVNTKAVILHGGSYVNPILTSRFAFPLKYLQKPVLVPFFNFIKKYDSFMQVLSRINFWNGISCLIFRYLYFTGNQTAYQLIYISAMAPTSDTGAVAESMLQLMQFDVTGQLGKIQIPVLIIGGISDRLNTVRCSKYIHRHIKNSTLKIVKQGHQSMVENHMEINTAVDQFINEVL
ncbi:MAG: putative hydrolase or acyltransferase of alpha/beta superfamily [Mucilaginibacter sp.]|nr:putative hydrolase or acyltransferase of alpha/beta superfamily [Mucilaginibacter sp.]